MQLNNARSHAHTHARALRWCSEDDYSDDFSDDDDDAVRKKQDAEQGDEVRACVRA